MKSFEYVIFEINSIGAGAGIGKNIIATVPIRNLKKKYPDKKLIVISPWAEVFRYNSNIYRVYTPQVMPYFYDDFMTKGLYLRTEPYQHPDYIFKEKHLTECWCEQLGVEFDSSKPDLYFTGRELEQGNNFMRAKNKPVFLMQFQGGAGPKKKENGTFEITQSFIRSLNMKVARNVAKEMSKKYHVIILQNKDQPIWNEAEILNLPLRQTLAALINANKYLLIDSFAQHALSAMNKKATVCWCGTSPDVLGYPIHNNLRVKVCETPECHRPNSFLHDVDHKNAPWSCPCGEDCRNYDEADILEALK